MTQQLPFIVIIFFLLFASTAHAQSRFEVKLKTNANDTLTIREMYTYGNGVGEAIRIYKILGKKYAYGTYALDSIPQFPGGERKFKDTIYSRASALYPETQKIFKIEFVIDYDGKLTDFKFIWSEHPRIDRTLTKFIKSLPKWTPGVKDNKYVKVKYDFLYR
jgi:protein TonB